MPITKITTSATFQLKDKAGYIRNLSCSNAGTSWTLQLFDGPDGLGNADLPMYGGTSPGTITTGLLTIQPIYFSKGIKVVTAGASPGELDVDWT
jgi:hypothetical protein